MCSPVSFLDEIRQPFGRTVTPVTGTATLADIPVETLRTMPDQIRQNVFMDRFISIFAAAFAGLATLLAAIGLYGVLAYTVAQRTREIGVRMALGASPRLVLAMVLRQVGIMTLVGGVIGIGAAIGAGRLAQSLLFRMQGFDPLVLGGAAVVLSLVAFGAGAVPAMRASRVKRLLIVHRPPRTAVLPPSFARNEPTSLSPCFLVRK